MFCWWIFAVFILVAIVDALNFPVTAGVVSSEDVLEQTVGVSASDCQRQCMKHGSRCTGNT